MRLDRWLAAATERLDHNGIEGARTEARVLAASALDADPALLFAHPEWEVPSGGDLLLERRLTGEPLAYITGFREFYGRRFVVNPAVLVPRQETELLVETGLEFAPTNASVLDIGTGSGCVAITLKLQRPSLQVTAVDVSAEALAVAVENARELGADVSFAEADLFPVGKFDVIVSNPPYIAEGAELPRDVGEHEPRLALFAGTDGLTIYRRLATEARSHLNEGGLIAIELGDGMRKSVEDLFGAEGWRSVIVKMDLSGIERTAVFAPS
jgi:release factor glutamine methyltransferase